jgi:cytochrome c556
MRGKSGALALCGAALVGLVGFAVIASEKPPDSYVKNMKDTNTAAADLRKSVEAKDYQAIARQAASIKVLFDNTLSFWEERKAEDAIGFAKTGSKAAADLEAAAKSKNDDGVASAAKAVQGICKTCHDAHRERLPDGSSEIK